MSDNKTKLTHTYCIDYTEEVTYQEYVEAEDKEQAEEIFLNRLADGELEPLETNGGELEITEE